MASNRRNRTWNWGWAATGCLAGFAGCHTTRNTCDFPSQTVGCAAAPASAAPCAGCGVVGCNGACGHAGLKQKLRDYDWEQLRNDHCWPTQYNHEAFRRTSEPLQQQMVNGLAQDATLYEHHFLADDKHAELSDPGKHRLQYLARQRPYQVRTVFLQASFDPALDQARANEVHAYLQKVSFEPGDWQLAVAPVVPTGLSGPEVIGIVNNMTGIQQGAAPMSRKYETILRNTFFQGTGSGGVPGGGS